MYWDTGNADVTRLRRYVVACAQPKSCWRSQPSSSKARGGPILVRKLHMHCCMLYEPLQVLAQHSICCLHKLELCERKATPDSEFLVHLGQLAAFCLLLSACCFAGKLAYYARQPPCFAIKFELPRRSLLQALLTTQPRIWSLFTLTFLTRVADLCHYFRPPDVSTDPVRARVDLQP